MNVLTIGTFDLFHYGHVRLLKWCRDLAGPDGYVTAGVNDDVFVYTYKGKGPVVDDEARLEVVAACRYVDKAVYYAGPVDNMTLLETVKPDIIVVGSDWLEKDYLAQLGVSLDWLTEADVTIAFVPRTKGVSSSEIREASAV